MVPLALCCTGPAAAQVTAATSSDLRLRAEQLRRDQRFGEALRAYEALVQRDPGNLEDRFWVAKLESWTGKLEAAESAFVQLLAEQPDDYDSRIALADIHLWRGHGVAALTILQSLNQSHPSDPEVLVRLGHAAELTGDLRKARGSFSEVIEIDPSDARAREGLRRLATLSRWQADLEYYGEQLSNQESTNGVTISLGCCASDRLRWRTAATLQEKLNSTEARFGGELALRLIPPLEVQWSAYLAPGAALLPQQAYGMGLSHKIASRLVLSADYRFLDFQDARVHQAGPGLELYAGRHWLLGGRYRYSSTRFNGTQGAVGNDGGSVTLGYIYGAANLIRVVAAAGAESFTQPSRELIGEFRAHTIGGAWRHFLTARMGFEVAYAHQSRSNNARQDSYSLRVVQRW
ncbi:MAG TPA: tetratricopeptide repeat protein [Gemmatimonadales bacterium]|jgi:YaiO family outer membrane protein